mgnify:CR=1 FL=1
MIFSDKVTTRSIDDFSFRSCSSLVGPLPNISLSSCLACHSETRMLINAVPPSFSQVLSRKYQIIGFHRNAALTSLLETRGNKGKPPRGEILKVLQAVGWKTKADGKVSPGVLFFFSRLGKDARESVLCLSRGARKPRLRDASFYSRDSLIALPLPPPTPCSFDHNYLKREKFWKLPPRYALTTLTSASQVSLRLGKAYNFLVSWKLAFVKEWIFFSTVICRINVYQVFEITKRLSILLIWETNGYTSPSYRFRKIRNIFWFNLIYASTSESPFCVKRKKKHGWKIKEY